MALAFLRRFWKPIAGGLAVLALLLLHRSWVADAKREARDAAFAEVRAASQVVADSWREKADAADMARAKAEARAEALAQSERLEVRTYYETRPDAAAVRCLPDERVRRSQAARDAILSAATGKRD